MPKNKVESIIFTAIMCSLMVVGMSCYNLVLHQDFSFMNLLKGFIPGFIVAYLLDTFVVGTIAKKVAFKLPFIDKSEPIQLILSISCCMIIGMVSLMSVFGIVVEQGVSGLSVSSYSRTWIMNLVVALPYQLLIVGPLSRKVLSNIQSKSNAVV